MQSLAVWLGPGAQRGTERHDKSFGGDVIFLYLDFGGIVWGSTSVKIQKVVYFKWI